MSSAGETSLPLPEFVEWSIFPFGGEPRVREPTPLHQTDRPCSGMPVQVFLETREDLDMDDLDDEPAGELELESCRSTA
jgi:hypothetical protein